MTYPQNCCANKAPCAAMSPGPCPKARSHTRAPTSAPRSPASRGRSRTKTTIRLGAFALRLHGADFKHWTLNETTETGVVMRSAGAQWPMRWSSAMTGAKSASPCEATQSAWLQAVRALLQSAVPGMRKDNPCDGIKSIRLSKSKGQHTWTDSEIELYRSYWSLGTQQRLVLEFALETVSRRGKVVRLGPQHIHDGRIESSVRTEARMLTSRLHRTLKRHVTQCQNLT